MGLLKSIELPDFDADVIMQKYDMKDNVIKKGSVLTVREGQVAVFCDKGRAADIFIPGMYKLDTDSLPIITSLLSWKYGFETPFKSDIFFINTKEFTGIRWGTANPVPIQTEYGIIRLRGHGTYSFKVSEPAVFFKVLAGTSQQYTLYSVCDTMRALLVGSISSAFGTCHISLNDMASRYKDLGNEVKLSAAERLAELGIALTAFEVESLSLPPELEKAIDETARLGIMRNTVDVYTQLAQADALKEAAKHGTAGTIVGVGMGMRLNKEFAGTETAAQSTASSAASRNSNSSAASVCLNCKAALMSDTKFCPECGTPVPSKKFCTECGAPLQAGAKFCPECGQKV